jgi:hypothetical protein
MLFVLTPLLFGLSFLSGKLGLSVAFVAIPVLGRRPRPPRRPTR